MEAPPEMQTAILDAEVSGPHAVFDLVAGWTLEEALAVIDRELAKVSHTWGDHSARHLGAVADALRALKP